jgi:electron transfer flavoprotein alpha subunit
VSLEAITAARALAEDGTVVALVLGGGANAAAVEATSSGVDRTLFVEIPEQGSYTAARWARAIEAAIAMVQPRVVILAGTTSGRDLGPYLAVRAGSACLSDCIAVRWDGEALVGTRPVYQGKMLTEVRVRPSEVAFVVVRGGSFPAPDAGEPGPAEELPVTFEPGDSRVTVVGVTEKPAGTVPEQSMPTSLHSRVLQRQVGFSITLLAPVISRSALPRGILERRW